MIGNDVIDLDAARKESNWRRKGFLQKLFTPDEQECILCHHDPELMVWLLWSMKEAAYKVLNRSTGLRAFMPHRLSCSINYTLEGRVVIGKSMFYTKSSVTGPMIETVAVTNPYHFTLVEEVKEKVIYKNKQGLPYILLQNLQEIPVSKSHHGRFSKVVSLVNYNM